MISADEFERQLQFIKENNYQVVPMDQAIELLITEKAKNGKYICITFDDGYENNYEIAWPILKKWNYPAHFFLTSKYLNRNQRITKNNQQFDIPYMDEQMIKDLIANGCSIGAHSVSHSNLTACSEEKCFDELIQSKNELERTFSVPINTFSYPYSYYDKRVIKAVKKSGYDYAFSLEYRSIKSINSKMRYRISRMVIHDNENIDKFTKKLSGNYDWVYFYTNIKRNLSIFLKSIRKQK